MLVRLLVLLMLLPAVTPAGRAQSERPVATMTAEEQADEVAYVRDAFAQISSREREVTGDVAPVYQYIHGRAWQLGDVETARAALGRLVAHHEAHQGEDQEGLATTLANLAVMIRNTGDYHGALGLHRRGLEIREAVLGPDHPDVADSLNNLGAQLADLGDYEAARPMHERALAIQEATLGPGHHRVASSLNNLGLLLSDLGQHETARPLHERALEIRRAVHGSDHLQVALSLNNLGDVLKDLGDPRGGLPYHEEALRIRRLSRGPRHPDVASSLNGLGNLHRALGDLEQARAHYQEAVDIWENTLGPDHPEVGMAVGNLANAHMDLGQHDAARVLYERSMRIQEVALGPHHPSVARARNSLGNLLRRTGDFDAARPLLERALAVWERVLGGDHPLVATNRTNLALLAADRGDWPAAWTLMDTLARERRARLTRTLAALTEGEALLYLAGERDRLDALLTAGTHGNEADVTTSAYGHLLAWKGQLGRRLMERRQHLLDGLTSEQQQELAMLREVQGRLSRLALRTSVADRAAHEARLAALRAERDDLERALGRSIAVGEAVEVTARDVVGVLPPRSAVVDLLVHRTYRPARVEDGVFVAAGRLSEPRMSAWILRDGDPRVRHEDLGPAAAIEVATAAFLESLLTRRGAALPDDETVVDDHDVLRALVWEPLAPHLEGVETIFLSPDDVLGTLPFGTLRDDTGRYLVEEHAFIYPSDVASLAALPPDSTPLGRVAASLLSVGGVDFRERAEFGAGSAPTGLAAEAEAGAPSGRGAAAGAASDALRGSFTSYWGRLPATGYESQVVSDMHEEALADDAPRLLLQGAEATEERLEAEMPRHAMLHIATHGYFQPEGLPSMWEAALDAVSGERGMQMTETATRLTGLHPGLLSGLVLAGANRPPEDDVAATRETDGTAVAVRDDGYLTASEVALLDLSGVDLVVLSACETALGRPQSGEGLLGLRRAFHMAGADTVISSLWSVKDESTSELMQAFYANLFFKGMGRHQALRAAQLDMLSKNRMEHGAALPSTWGAFVLSGDWR